MYSSAACEPVHGWLIGQRMRARARALHLLTEPSCPACASPPRHMEFERRGMYRDRYDDDPYGRGPPYGRGSPPPPPRQIKQCARHAWR